MSKTLRACCEQIAQGGDIDVVENNAIDTLENHGFTVDYVTFREITGLKKARLEDIAENTEIIVLAAAKIGAASSSPPTSSSTSPG